LCWSVVVERAAAVVCSDPAALAAAVCSGSDVAVNFVAGACFDSVAPAAVCLGSVVADHAAVQAWLAPPPFDAAFVDLAFPLVDPAEQQQALRLQESMTRRPNL
jgi:hypothetical protein